MHYRAGVLHRRPVGQIRNREKFQVCPRTKNSPTFDYFSKSMLELNPSLFSYCSLPCIICYHSTCTMYSNKRYNNLIKTFTLLLEAEGIPFFQCHVSVNVVYVCIYMCMHVCMCACLHICMYMYMCGCDCDCGCIYVFGPRLIIFHNLALYLRSMDSDSNLTKQ